MIRIANCKSLAIWPSGGRCPAPSTWGPPENVLALPCVWKECWFCCVLIFSATCLICCHLVSAWFSEVLIATLRTAKCWDKTFGVIVLCWDCYSLLRHRGAVPAVEGYLYPSVLRSPGVTPQKCRAAHGPRHPAVTLLLRLCLIGEWFFGSVLSGYMFGLLCGIFGL